MGLQLSRWKKKEREKGEAGKCDSLAGRLSWETGYLDFSPESTLNAQQVALWRTFLGRGLPHSFSYVTLTAISQVNAISIPPFHRWGSCHSKSWNLNTKYQFLVSRPYSVHHPAMPHCGNPFSLLVRMVWIQGTETQFKWAQWQLYWKDGRVRGQRMPQGWGEWREVYDHRILSFLCAPSHYGCLLSSAHLPPPHSHPQGRGVVSITSQDFVFLPLKRECFSSLSYNLKNPREGILLAWHGLDTHL